MYRLHKTLKLSPPAKCRASLTPLELNLCSHLFWFAIITNISRNNHARHAVSDCTREITVFPQQSRQHSLRFEVGNALNTSLALMLLMIRTTFPIERFEENDSRIWKCSAITSILMSSKSYSFHISRIHCSVRCLISWRSKIFFLYFGHQTKW